MLKRIVMLIRGLMGCPSTDQSTPTMVTRCNSAKPLRVKSTQPCKDVQTQRRPVKPAVKAKSARVLRGTTARSQAPEQAPVQQQQETQSGERGRKQATLASQPASKSQTRKPKAVQPTTVAASRKPAQKPAQTTSGKRGRPRKTPV